MVNAGKDITLMLIDSDRHVRESIKVFFGVSRVEVLVFKTGAQGLNALKHQRADVVIADYFLTDMDGVACLDEVKRLHPAAVRILMATITSDDLAREVQKAGINRFIEKPLTVASLDTVINELVATKF